MATEMCTRYGSCERLLSWFALKIHAQMLPKKCLNHQPSEKGWLLGSEYRLGCSSGRVYPSVEDLALHLLLCFPEHWAAGWTVPD